MRSLTSLPISTHTQSPTSSTAPSRSGSRSAPPGGRTGTTGSTPSSCPQSESSLAAAAASGWMDGWIDGRSHLRRVSCPRSYDTTLDYFINVSASCGQRSRPVAVVRLEVGVFASLCQYFSESEQQWRTDGMVPLAETNASRAVCRTRHLTAFGAGMIVPPGAVSFIMPVRGKKKKGKNNAWKHFAANANIPSRFCRSAVVFAAWWSCWWSCWVC